MTVLSEPALDAAAARRAMIDSQLRPSGVNDPRVLARFADVAREAFVPAASRAVAYVDRAVPLGNGLFLAPALTHGQMLVEAAPRLEDRALMIDGGTGYLAALLKPMVGSLDVIAPGGKPRGKDYTLLLIDGAIEEFPAILSAALADDGRVVTGLIERGVSRLAVGRKAAGTVGLLTLGEADFAPLAAYAPARKWSF
jgi:protein-L-isoaspartate(D-aspartate) O-methyltransferase